MNESTTSLASLGLLAREGGGSREGDAPHVVRRWVADHADFLWRTLRRLGVPEAQVDDALQQVFLAASARVADVRPGSERAFLFSTAMNVAAHARRALARSRERQLDEAHDDLRDPRLGPAELLEHRRARALLDEVLDAMPTDLRVVFVLFELEELTMAQIAELVALPPGTVASRLRRAREHFHRLAERLRRGSNANPGVLR